MKRELTDKFLKAQKPEKKEYKVMDSMVRGFGFRVLPSGVKSFVFVSRFPGAKNPVCRSLGRYGELALAQARERARAWREMLNNGLDPAIEEERERHARAEAERKSRINTFAAALDAYLKHKADIRSIDVISRDLRKECAAWMERPVTEITTRDVKELILGVKARGKAQAHNILNFAKGMFTWCVNSGDFGLDVSPCARIKAKDLIGVKNVRSHVLRDCEVAAYWKAAGTMSFPSGALLQLLVLTAVRVNEAAQAQWSEINMDAALWTIPASRMKSGMAHTVPLVPDIRILLEGLPRFDRGDYIFSTTGGQRPVGGLSRAKQKLDTLMRADLEMQGTHLDNFILHDIRRTVRTRLSSLPMENHIRELLLGHSQPGLHRTYDLHRYDREKAYALTLWHARLHDIVEPKGAVIPFPASA